MTAPPSVSVSMASRGPRAQVCRGVDIRTSSGVLICRGSPWTSSTAPLLKDKETSSPDSTCSWTVLTTTDVAGAEVFVYHEAALPMSRHVSAGDGSVALPLPEENATLLVRAQGYAHSYIENPLEVLQEQHGRIVLQPAFALRGLVTDEAGVPLAGARASIRAALAHSPCSTTEDGRFSFESLLETPDTTIEASVTELLLEASRLHDENRI